MSESAARFRQPIDLDEFEQRLRAGTPSPDPAKSEDPLAELARLVGQADPFRAATVPPQLRPAAARPGAAAATARGSVPHLQQVHPPLDRADPPFGLPAPEQPYASVAAAASPEPQLHSFEQPLPYEPVYAVGDVGGEAGYPVAAAPTAEHRIGDSRAAADVPSAAMIAAAEGDVPRRSWRGVIILSAVLATGFAGLAAALTMKGSLSSGTAGIARSSGHEPPVILAGGPTKVQPPKNAADVPDDQPSVLDKTASSKPTKAKLVDNAEQPVDLSQQPAGARASAAQNGPAVAPSAGAPALSPDAGAITAKPAAGRQVASLDPVAATPGPMGSRDGANAVAKRSESDPPAGPARSGFPEPRRVKVVSVRPDGSIIGSEADAQPARPAAAPEPAPIELGVSMPSAADPMAAQAPAPVDTPASTARTDAPVLSPQVNKPEDRGRGRDAVAALIESPRGGQQKSAERADAPAAEAPKLDAPKSDAPKADSVDAIPATKPRHGRKKNAEVADLGNQDKTAAQDAGAGDGSFAAQLAASPTESAAKATLRKLKKKYGSTFGNHKLSYRRVKVEGKTVFRVRLTGLTKDDATSVCGKLQGDGGTCFVAHP